MNRQRGFALTGAAMYLVVALAVALALSWAGSGLAIWWMDGKIDAANAKFEEEKEAHGRSKQGLSQWKETADECSRKTEELGKTAADALATQKVAAQKALAAAQKGKLAAEQEAERIRNAPRPAGMTECDAMKKELSDEIDRRTAAVPTR